MRRRIAGLALSIIAALGFGAIAGLGAYVAEPAPSPMPGCSGQMHDHCESEMPGSPPAG
ncbi:hypothetical protein ABZS66_11995 [Dactylosporangium sp. NPDC005572]|uniref:hypothetical protein n=1 Tax=Dactylosporangium sp. NPDC005572 TaxID=3156889 RepID=UPI0033B849A0